MTLSADLWAANADLAEAALRHPFVAGIADGTLPRAAFAGYVAQDAFFLESFARAYALGVAHSPDRATLDAWSHARPGAPAYRSFVEHWTLPGFAGYVAGLEAAADGVPAPGADAVFAEVVAAEVAFWDMAMEAA